VFGNDHIHFQGSNAKIKGRPHCRYSIFRHQSATTTVPLFIERWLHSFLRFLGFLTHMTGCKKTNNSQHILKEDFFVHVPVLNKQELPIPYLLLNNWGARFSISPAIIVPPWPCAFNFC